MIFLSHTSTDKDIIEPIAISLANIYGQENVFYDSWSIQPGDGIIDRMSEGLRNCKFFFYFVSNNSLKSKMCDLEWQNSLLKAAKGQIKFIPVRLDQCNMPDILFQTLYIDVFTNGLEAGLRQIVDVINGSNTFRPRQNKFSNIKAFITKNSETEFIIEFRAIHYMEPIATYGIIVDNDLENIKCDFYGESMGITNEHPNVQNEAGEIHNFILRGAMHPTTPGFPFRVKLYTTNGESIKLASLAHAESEKYFAPVPYSFIN